MCLKRQAASCAWSYNRRKAVKKYRKHIYKFDSSDWIDSSASNISESSNNRDSSVSSESSKSDSIVSSDSKDRREKSDSSASGYSGDSSDSRDSIGSTERFDSSRAVHRTLFGPSISSNYDILSSIEISNSKIL